MDKITQEFNDKIKAGMFRPVARYLTNPQTAEDRMQEGLALTWHQFYRNAHERGKILSDAILVHACRLRATNLSRHIEDTKGHWRYHDALDERAYKDGKVEVLRYDGLLENNDEDDPQILQYIGFAEECCTSTERKLNSALDLESWLADQTARDSSMLEMRQAGYSVPKIATELGVSTSTAYERIRRLGRELAGRAGVRLDYSRKRHRYR